MKHKVILEVVVNDSWEDLLTDRDEELLHELTHGQLCDKEGVTEVYIQEIQYFY